MTKASPSEAGPSTLEDFTVEANRTAAEAAFAAVQLAIERRRDPESQAVPPQIEIQDPEQESGGFSRLVILPGEDDGATIVLGGRRINPVHLSMDGQGLFSVLPQALGPGHSSEPRPAEPDHIKSVFDLASLDRPDMKLDEGLLHKLATGVLGWISGHRRR